MPIKNAGAKAFKKLTPGCFLSFKFEFFVCIHSGEVYLEVFEKLRNNILFKSVETFLSKVEY